MTIEEVDQAIQRKKDEYNSIIHCANPDSDDAIKRRRLIVSQLTWLIEDKRRIREAMRRGEADMAHGAGDDGRKEKCGMGPI